jgi:hypothetical protein
MWTALQDLCRSADSPLDVLNEKVEEMRDAFAGVLRATAFASREAEHTMALWHQGLALTRVRAYHTPSCTVCSSTTTCVLTRAAVVVVTPRCKHPSPLAMPPHTPHAHTQSVSRHHHHLSLSLSRSLALCHAHITVLQ